MSSAGLAAISSWELAMYMACDCARQFDGSRWKVFKLEGHWRVMETGARKPHNNKGAQHAGNK